MKKKSFEKGREEIFERGKLKIKARLIKNFLVSCGESTPILFSSAMVLLKPNWLVIPLSDGEINENSVHPLATAFKILGLSAFSIYGDSILIAIQLDQEPLTVARKVSNFLFRCQENEEVKNFIRLDGSFKNLRQFLGLPDLDHNL